MALPHDPHDDPGQSLLLTDLYQLNMVQAYLDADMTETAVFEFFVRRLPTRRNFLLATGLDQVLHFLETARFHDRELEWLRASGRFSDALIDALADFRFTGDVDAMPEGTPFFPDEPILRVIAPLPHAQLMETRIINVLHLQTVIASKAVRMVFAASGRQLVDFGLRRAHGAEAGLLAARASYLAGFAGSATVLAQQRFGVPVFGTMAHSFVQAHDDEAEAFAHFARSRPDQVVLLIDTYDTPNGARKVVALAPRLAAEGLRIAGVRLDSGDLAALARTVRNILDDGGLRETRIMASGGLDEDKLAALAAAGAPIDGYGIGTSLTTSEDAPALDCAYKLQEYAGRPKRKRSAGKATWPGRKQVFRHIGADGRIARDVLGLADEEAGDGTPLLVPVMRDGRRVGEAESLDAVRNRIALGLEALPEPLRALDPAPPYPVEVSERLRALAREVDRETS
jgi:nicotinate phosphoribosyltransferase